MTARHLINRPKPAYADLPVVYMDEMVRVGSRLWWRNLGQECAACGGQLMRTAPAGKYDGWVSCLQCGREVATVLETRVALPRVEAEPPKRGRPPKLPDTFGVGCLTCGGPRYKLTNSRYCRVHHNEIRREQNHQRQADARALVVAKSGWTRPPCIVCGAPTSPGVSFDLCREHYNARRRQARRAS